VRSARLVDGPDIDRGFREAAAAVDQDGARGHDLAPNQMPARAPRARNKSATVER